MEDEPTLQTQKLRRKYKLEYHAKFPSREHSRRALRAYDARKDWGVPPPSLTYPRSAVSQPRRKAGNYSKIHHVRQTKTRPQSPVFG
jgi:hypothetical protein